MLANSAVRFVGISHNQFPHHQNGSASILTNELLNFSTMCVELMCLPVCPSPSTDFRPALTEHPIQTPVYGSCFRPTTSTYSLAKFAVFFYQDLHKIWCTLAVPFCTKSPHTAYMTPNKGREKSARLVGRVTLYTDYASSTILRYYTIAVQIAAPGTNI